MLARNVEHLLGLNPLEELGHGVERSRLLAVGEIPGVHDEGRRVGRALILVTTSCSVAAASLLASPLKPTCESLIWTKLKLPAAGSAAAAGNTREDRMPPVAVQTTPVPTQAMHSKKPRRLMRSMVSPPMPMIS